MLSLRGARPWTGRRLPRSHGRVEDRPHRAERRVIAASDGRGLLTETIALDVRGRTSGYDRDQDGTVTAFHHTPGYETYRGLGWYGGILQGAGEARR